MSLLLVHQFLPQQDHDVWMRLSELSADASQPERSRRAAQEVLSLCGDLVRVTRAVRSQRTPAYAGAAASERLRKKFLAAERMPIAKYLLTPQRWKRLMRAAGSDAEARRMTPAAFLEERLEAAVFLCAAGAFDPRTHVGTIARLRTLAIQAVMADVLGPEWRKADRTEALTAAVEAESVEQASSALSADDGVAAAAALRAITEPERLATALRDAGLSAGEARVLALTILEYTPKEIAAQLHRKAPTVRAWLHRARRKLRTWDRDRLIELLVQKVAPPPL